MPEKIIGVIAPHKKISRLVTEADLERVFQDAEAIYKLLNKKIGMYRRFYAIAHQQCVGEDPLRFFVVNNLTEEFKDWSSVVIINPVIIRHTNNEIESEEACASFATMPVVKVSRWNKCEVSFTPLVFDSNNKPLFGERKTMNFSGKIAKVFQHEIDHLDARYIYDIK